MVDPEPIDVAKANALILEKDENLWAAKPIATPKMTSSRHNFNSKKALVVANRTPMPGIREKKREVVDQEKDASIHKIQSL